MRLVVTLLVILITGCAPQPPQGRVVFPTPAGTDGGGSGGGGGMGM